MAARLPGVLPSRDDLGQLPSARSGRPVGRIDMDAVTAHGRGVEALGAGLANLGEKLQQRADQDEDAEVQRQLLEFEQARARRLDEDRRTLTGDPAGFADRSRAELTEAGRALFAQARASGLSQRALRRLDLGLSSTRDRFHTSAYSAELGQRGAYGEQWATERLNALTQDYQAAPDDEARRRILESAEGTVAFGRRTYGFSSESEQRLLGTARQMVEFDILSRPDSYSALMELRQGDPRVRALSSGEISDTQLQRLTRRPGMTPAEQQTAVAQLRPQAQGLSRLIREGLNEGVSLTQAEHDALVSFGLARGEDALQELMPSVNSSGPGRLSSVAQAMRSPGGLTAQEQPVPGQAAPAPGGGDVEILPAPGGRTPLGVSPRTGEVAGLVLHHTGGSTLDGALSHNRFARTGYHYYIDRDGSIYQFTPDNQIIGHVMPSGHASRIPGAWEHLTSANTIGISVVAPNEAGQTPEQRAALLRLTGRLSSQYGITPDNVVGHGELQTSRETSEGALAREIREGRASLTGATVTGGGPQADPRIAELADLLQGNAPSGRYASLPAARRRVLIRDLSHALRDDAKAEIDLDIASIRMTGEPRRLPNGSASPWLDRAPNIFTPMQADGFARQAREARAQFLALQGLGQMTPGQMADHLSTISPIGDTSTGVTPRTRPVVARAMERITELRRTAPALWASGTYLVGERGSQRVGENGQFYAVPAEEDIRVAPAPEVTRAYRHIARRRPDLQIQISDDGEAVTAAAEPVPGQLAPADARPQTLILTDPRLTPEDRRAIIEARLAAMQRVEVPESDRRILRPDEAAALLRLPTRAADMSRDEYDRLLRQAADRAMTLFGPQYARAAFNDAWRFRTGLDAPRRRIAADMGDRLPGFGRMGGDDLTEAMSLYNEDRDALDQLTQEQAIWRYGAPSMGQTPFGPLMGAPRPSGRPGYAGARAAIGAEAGIAPPVLGAPSGVTGMPGGLPSVPGVGVASWPRPTPEDIAILLSNPRQAQQRFDQAFGPGAAATYLRR